MLIFIQNRRIKTCLLEKNVKLSHYHETDGENLANWQWDEKLPVHIN
jgi:hypothetical protein